MNLLLKALRTVPATKIPVANFQREHVTNDGDQVRTGVTNLPTAVGASVDAMGASDRGQHQPDVLPPLKSSPNSSN
jgi:hypothetical protein